MFTNKDINTIKGLFYAASCTKSSYDPTVYHNEFSDALERYFTCYPNSDESDDDYCAGDSPASE